MKQKKQYHPKQPYRRDKKVRARRSVHNSLLPVWIARIPAVQKFRHMSRKKKVTILGASGVAVLLAIALFTTVFFANSLGSKEEIMNRNKTGVTLLDRSGTVFYEFNGANNNTVVSLDQIPKHTQQALIASEDKNFYTHGGFSPIGIGNALWQNIKPGGIDNGGSTLTQQLVASALLNKDRNYLRKYQELVLSIEIERRYSKDEILEMYLNSVYFGEGAFGIEDASQTYFGKPASELTLAESSMLVGLLPAPSAYSPITGSPEKAKVRQNYVLGRMVEDGYITEDEKTQALATELAFAPPKAEEDFDAPHFALMVKDELEEEYGEERVARSGYVVTTTLDLKWQNIAQEAVAAQVNRLSSQNVSNGAAVVLDSRTGEVRAMVGSADWSNEQFGKFNAANAKRQPGSSFKPLVYATGIENRDFSAATIFKDVATDFGGYQPKNYDLRFHGDVTTRTALANSYNIPAIKALQQAGISETIQTAQDFGITTLDNADDAGLAMALGTEVVPLTEMTDAFATLANAGQHNDISYIRTITDKSKKQIYNYEPEDEQVISDETAHIMSSMLSDNAARASTFGSSLTLSGGRLAAVKTGTTEDYKDSLTIGYTPTITTGVWVGNNDNTPMSRVAGSSGAGPIWRNIMNQTLAGTKNESFTPPRTITARLICRSNGALAETNNGSATLTEYFRPGTLPTKKCNEKVEEPAPVQVTPAPKPTTPDDEEDDTSGSGDGDDDTDEDEDTDGEGDSGTGDGGTSPLQSNNGNQNRRRGFSS